MDRPQKSAEQFLVGNFRAVVAVLLFFIFAFYQLMFLHHRPYEVDNPWFLSFSYGFRVDHDPFDHFMFRAYPAGMDGTHLFGKTAAFLQSCFVAPFGWTQRPAAVFSGLLIVAALACWAATLRRLRFSLTRIVCFVLVLGLSEPALSAAERFRYEPVSFLLISLALLMSAYGNIFWPVFLSCAAIEVEPMAVAGIATVSFFLWKSAPRTLRSVLLFAGGALTAAALGLYLHPEFLHPGFLRQGPDVGLAGHMGILLYFVGARHIVDIAAFVVFPAAFFLFRQKGSPRLPHVGWAISCAVITMFISMLPPHSNVAYAIFVFPFLVMITLALIPSSRLLLIFTCIFCTISFVECALLWGLNRGEGYTNADFVQVRAMLESGRQAIHVDPGTLQIEGPYSLWFAHPHNFHANTIVHIERFKSTDLLLCQDGAPPGTSQPTQVFYCSDYQRLLPNLRLLAKAELRHNPLYLYSLKPAD